LITPEISTGFIGIPEVVYLPIVLDPEFATKKYEPDTAMPIGVSKPETSAGFIGIPEVVYSPIEP
jgi:hypothetical protein